MYCENMVSRLDQHFKNNMNKFGDEATYRQEHNGKSYAEVSLEALHKSKILLENYEIKLKAIKDKYKVDLKLPDSVNSNKNSLSSLQLLSLSPSALSILN